MEWKQPLPDIHKPRELVEYDDTIYLGATNSVYALSQEDGSIQWQAEPSSWIVAVQNELVYVNDYVNLRAYDAESGDQQWKFGVDEKTDIVDAALLGDRIYLLAEKLERPHVDVSEEFERLYALDAETGDVVWQHEELAASNDTTSEGQFQNVYAEDGTVYLGHESGILQAFAPDGTKRWKTDVEAGFLYVGPESTGDTLYLSDRQRLIAIAKDGGEVQWERSNCGNRPINVEGQIYCHAGSDARVTMYTAIEEDTRQNLWEKEFQATGVTPYMSSAEVLYTPLRYRSTSVLVALGGESGCIFGHFQLGGTTITPPLVTNDTVYIGSGSDESAIYALSEL